MLGRSLKVAFAALFVCVLHGCGSDAPDIYHVSGTVDFDGKPVPKGQISFMPDTAKGNTGVAGYATIIDGKYDTSLEGGKGHVGGPMIVQIEGQDPSSKTEGTEDTGGEEIIKTLFAGYRTTADLPKEDSTKDFPVPKEAGKPIPQEEGGGSKRLAVP